MPADDEMTIDERYKYLKKMEARYRAADRAGRSVLLTEMAAVTGLHRKSLVRLLVPDGLVRQRRQDRGVLRRMAGREARTGDRDEPVVQGRAGPADDRLHRVRQPDAADQGRDEEAGGADEGKRP